LPRRTSSEGFARGANRSVEDEIAAGNPAAAAMQPFSGAEMGWPEAHNASHQRHWANAGASVDSSVTAE
jgi:hypothetical protein